MNHQHHTLPSGQKMHYTAWGSSARPAVVCVHGLTRNARDFDALAKALSSDFYVLCVDVIGRGQSDWAHGVAEYNVQRYAQDILDLLYALNLRGETAPHWVGTSMGGLIALTLQLLAPKSYKKLVLNDVGPVIETIALQRIAQYIGAAPQFATRALAEAYARQVFTSFGAQTPAEWAALTDHYYLDNPDGSVRVHYDPLIATATKLSVAGLNPEALTAGQTALWASLTSLDPALQACLVLRGEHSDLLSEATTSQMLACNRGVRALTIPNCGHAPHLLDSFQTQAIKAFLL